MTGKKQTGRTLHSPLRFFKKKKKTVIIAASVLGVVVLLIGAFFLGRISVKDNSPDNNREIKEIKDEIKKPDHPEPIPSDKKEEKVLLHANEEIKGLCVFSNWLDTSKKEDIKVFLISKNHPRIKELLGQGKLKRDKWFTIRYGKVDKTSDGEITYTFNEDNQDLEIIET